MTPDPVGSEAWGCSRCWVDLLSIQKNMPPFNIIFEVWDVGPVLYSEELSKWQILYYTIFRHCPANFEGRGARRLKPGGGSQLILNPPRSVCYIYYYYFTNTSAPIHYPIKWDATNTLRHNWKDPDMFFSFCSSIRPLHWCPFVVNPLTFSETAQEGWNFCRCHVRRFLPYCCN